MNGRSKRSEDSAIVEKGEIEAKRRFRDSGKGDLETKELRDLETIKSDY